MLLQAQNTKNRNSSRYPMTVLKTERLVLRQFRHSDAVSMNSVFGDPEVMLFGDGTKSLDWVRGWIGRRIAEYREDAGIGVWAIVERSGEEAIGYGGLFFFEDVCGEPETEIGYRLARSYWGRGYATEAARAVRDYAFNTLNHSRLISMIDPENAASIRVAEKLGMSYEKDVTFDGYTHPDRVYATSNPLS
jgi:ribosomal-protein-alanine N-acetyltransferase